jgi:serine-type D-Ala-D-Ala endopeptidase (penicillin-binding protein 7)
VNVIRKHYALLLIVVSLAFMPMQIASANADTQNSTQSSAKKYIKKTNYQQTKSVKRKERLKAQRLAIAKQRAIDLGENYDGSESPVLASNRVLVVKQNTGEVVFAKNTNTLSPIASITKLMTAMLVLDAKQPLSEIIYVSESDVDTIKGTHSRLPVGTSLTRADMLQLALMSSENRAAFALASNYPGGRSAFIKAMNAKALSLGMMNSRFTEPTGLMFQNVSTAEDLYILVSAAHQYPEIREATTTVDYDIYINGREKPLHFKNTNTLVRGGDWDIGLSKTGYINEAGRCLVMQATIAEEPMIMVFLDAAATSKRTGDAIRIRKWVEHQNQNNQTLLAEQAVSQQPDDLQPNLVMTDAIYDN